MGMTVIRGGDVPPAVLSSPLISGDVSIQKLIDEQVDGNVAQCVVAMVNFAPGSRNTLHSHTTAQILVVTDGTGIVATEDEEVTVTPGTVIFIPAGTRHWHGATADSAFSHLSITLQAAQTRAAPAI